MSVFDIPYTLCFCVRGDFVLMLRRKYPPNEGLWNGLGGKIEAGESALECARREVFEEANMDVSESLRYAGIVTWNAGADPDTPERETSEGSLAWKPLSWVCDAENESVVSNVPRFLPAMLDSNSPMEFRYEGGRLVGVAENSPSSRI